MEKPLEKYFVLKLITASLSIILFLILFLFFIH